MNKSATSASSNKWSEYTSATMACSQNVGDAASVQVAASATGLATPSLVSKRHVTHNASVALSAENRFAAKAGLTGSKRHSACTLDT